MNIEYLPVEILRKIFSYLPRFDEVSLVSNLFNHLACETNDKNICLKIDNQFLKRYDWHQSIVKSTRKISKIKIEIFVPTEGTVRTIISIIGKFSAFIKSLTFLSSTYVTFSELLEILSLVPNVEHLAFNGLYENWPWRDELPVNIDIDLPKLKELSLRNLDDNLIAVFNQLTMGALKELEFMTFSLKAMPVLLKRQSNITKLKYRSYHYDIAIPDDFLTNVKLESLELYCGDLNYAKVLAKQTKLKSLTLPQTQFDRDFMRFVSSELRELDTLSMYHTWSPDPLLTPIADIRQLTRLKDVSLSLSIYWPDHLDSFSRLAHPAITALTLNFECWYTPQLINALANSLPNLKVLKFKGLILSEFHDTYDAIVSNFNFVESLHICRLEHDYDMDALNETGHFNPKLVELSIDDVCCHTDTEFVKKLIEDYPNLQRLALRATNARTSITILGQILTGFTKLETLKLLRCDRTLIMDYVNVLKKNRSERLQFVAIQDDYLTEGTFTDDVKRHLSDAFGVVSDSKGLLQMAVDRNTMKMYRAEERLWNEQYC